MFDAGKTRMIGLPYGEKNYDHMLSSFYLVPERNGQTDGRTDRFAEITNNKDCARGIVLLKLTADCRHEPLRGLSATAELLVYYYGRPLSVSGRPCYILPMFFLFFYGRLILRPWLTEVRESFTRGGP